VSWLDKGAGETPRSQCLRRPPASPQPPGSALWAWWSRSRPIRFARWVCPSSGGVERCAIGVVGDRLGAQGVTSMLRPCSRRDPWSPSRPTSSATGPRLRLGSAAASASTTSGRRWRKPTPRARWPGPSLRLSL